MKQEPRHQPMSGLYYIKSTMLDESEICFYSEAELLNEDLLGRGNIVLLIEKKQGFLEIWFAVQR